MTSVSEVCERCLPGDTLAMGSKYALRSAFPSGAWERGAENTLPQGQDFQPALKRIAKQFQMSNVETRQRRRQSQQQPAPESYGLFFKL